jgi:hypothetical protein
MPLIKVEIVRRDGKKKPAPHVILRMSVAKRAKMHIDFIG